MQIIPHTVRITAIKNAGTPNVIKDVEQLNNFVHYATWSKLGQIFLNNIW